MTRPAKSSRHTRVSFDTPTPSHRLKFSSTFILRFLFVLTIATSLYVLYVLNNISIFITTFSFSLTIGFLNLLNQLIPIKPVPVIGTRHPVSRPSRRSPFGFIIVSTLILLSGISAYFFYYRPRLTLDPMPRLLITDVSAAWQYTDPPVFIITGQLHNNNPLDLSRVQIKANIYPADSPTTSLSSQSVTLSNFIHNSTQVFTLKFADLSINSLLKYSLLVDSYQL